MIRKGLAGLLLALLLPASGYSAAEPRGIWWWTSAGHPWGVDQVLGDSNKETQALQFLKAWDFGRVYCSFSAQTRANSANNAYIVAFLGGATIDATFASVPWYQPRMALSYNYGPEPWVNIVQNRFASSGALAFQFTGSADGQRHFGYMDLQVNFTKSSDLAPWVVESLVIGDIKSETTPNAAVTIPITVKVTNIAIQGTVVGIDFIANHNADPSTFTLLTSPTLGPSAVWTPDEGASFSQIAEAQPPRGINQATYHVDTLISAGTSQFFRIKHQ